jgi:predicted nuclease of predicted toxin-antitoxin system
VRFLIDNCLSPVIARELSQHGYQSRHIRDYGLGNARDEDVLRKAVEEQRILITADADFGFVLALWRQSTPSVILFRGLSQRNPRRQAAVLIANVEELRDSLERGSLIVIEDNRVRVRALPIPG